MTKLLRFLLFSILLFSGSLKASENRLLFAPGDAIIASGPTTFCEGGNVVLTIEEQAIGATYQWFKDGAPIVPNALGKSYTAESSGSYHVVVTTNGTAVPFDAVTVVEHGKPTFDFSFTNDNKCSGATISFVAQVTSSSQITEYEWDFGDGQTSSASNPNHIYNVTGCGTQTYSVTLKITDVNGCSTTISKPISVLRKPDVEIKDVDVFFPFSNCHNSPTVANPKYTLTIDNISPSSGCITSYSLNWGDGTIQNGLTSSSFPISHTYLDLGEYNLAVTAIGSNGCSNVKNYRVANQSNPAGGLATSGGTTNLCAPEKSNVPFTISNWQDNSPGTIYHLKFGDGEEVILPHPLNTTGVDEIINHTYKTSSCPAPTFTATLNVINACDATPFTAGNIQINTKPISSFTLVKDPACANQSICFNNTTQAGSVGSACSSTTIYAWDFGDPSSSSNTSTLKDPCHLFSSPGIYTVTLTSSNPCGSSTVTKQICITSPLTPSFSLDNSTGCLNTEIKAINTTPAPISCNVNNYNWSVTYSSSNCGTSALWNFTNGTNASSENPSFLFKNSGTYIIKQTVTNACGVYSNSKNVVITAPPKVSITTNPGTCGPISFTPSASVTNCGTSALSYLWTFPGTSIPSSTAENPGVVTYTNPGTYQIRLQVTNECGTTESARTFTIAQPVTASPIDDKTYCRGERSPAISFTNTTNTNGVTYSWANSNIAIGLAASGTGNIPAFTTTTNSTTAVISGTITVTPRLNSCDGIPITFKINVNPSAPPANAGSDQKLCNQTTVTLAGNDPFTATGKWTLVSGPGSYTFDDDTKFNAIVSNLQADQTYIFKWTIAGFAPCGATFDQVTITNRPATTTANAGPDAIICDQTSSSNNSHVLQGNSIKSYETGEWTIIAQPTGSSATFYNNIKNSPTARIINLRPGTYRLKWSVINDVCTSGSEDEVILTVYALPVAGNITGVGNICYDNTFILTYNGTIGKIIDWEESIDNATWASKTTNTNTLTVNNHTQSKWYRIKLGSDGSTCNTAVYSSPKQVIANPLSVGGTTNGATTFCSGNNSGSITLSGHVGNVIRWEYSTDNTTFTSAPTNTSTTLNYSNIPATRYYRAIVKSGDCDEGYSSSVKITINPAAAIANAGPDRYLCNQVSTILAGNNPGAAEGKWTVVSGTGTSFADDTKYDTEVTGLIPGNVYEFKWTITGLSPCAPTADLVKIFNRSEITTANAGADNTLCDQNSSNNSYTLQGNLDVARTYETGKWTIESAPVGSTASFIDLTKPNTKITGLIPGEYTLKWTISNDASCTPSADLMTLKVYAKPEVGLVTTSTGAVCTGSNSGTLTLSSFTGAIALWESSVTQNGVYTPIAGENQSTYAFSNLTVDTWYKIKIVSKGQTDGNCMSSSIYSAPFKITVSPVSVGGTTTGEATVCTGTNTGTITLSGETGVVTGWQSSINGMDWTAISNSAVKPYSFNNLTQTTFFRAVVQSGVCSIAYSSTTEIKVLATVDVADAGASIYLCNFNGNTNLNANIPSNGIGEWKQIIGPPITFTDKYDAQTGINVSQHGTYVFEWTISNGICAPSSTTVSLFNYPSITNSIQGVNTYCYGQSVSVTGETPAGGNGMYTYTWESSSNGSEWNLLNGETGSNLNFIANQTTYLRRTVKSGPCEAISNTVLITVQPPISNNTLSEDQELCIGKPIASILGSAPTGGDGNFSYTWQSGANQSNWTTIIGANLPYFQPVDISSTTFFRRIVTTALCTGAQQSISNTIKITINSDAKAEFSASATSACIPFDLGSVITVTPHPDRNLSYEWFANGVSIGIGAAFPGYTITEDGDLVAIKLVTTSKFGCESDTKEIAFSTVKNVQALFSKDQAQGCGPFTVNFSNLSSPLIGGSYIWDFGNGQTSTATQPAPVVFQAHPLHRDTTYVITLKAATACAATIYTDSVKVRPKPLAIFSPDKTIGCSPLEINFSNQSLGMPNTYTIDFGNGDQIVKTNNETFSYTYLTTKTDTFTVKLYAENECGIDSTSYDIVVYPNTITPELVINGSSSYGCAPFTVKFDNNSTGANSFLWDFNDGTTATSSVSPGSMQHTFTQPGTYTVKLTATNGCSTASTTETVVIYPQPTANFTFDKLQYCLNEKVRFRNNSPDNYTFIWDFGDGLTSNAVHPEHAFATAGTFAVKLTATHTYPDGTSCSFSLVKQLEILPQPIAAFVTNANQLNCAPFTLRVHASQAQATGGVEWDFGDPTNPDHHAQGFTNSYTFTEPGLYTVKAIAYNQSGCADSTTQIIRITASPKASFSTADTMICGPGKNISFENTSSYEGTGTVGYRWYINNTFVSTVKNLTYNFNTPSNVILPYIFEVKLVALSTIGCPDTVIHKIQFNPLPNADFSLQQNIGCAPFNLIGSNTSTYADSFRWYLDDRLVSTDRTPQNINLNTPDKTYKLKLVSGNIYGCRLDSIEKTLNTHPKPIALFTVNDSVSCNGKLDLQTVNNSTGAISYTWNFGDATPESSAANPTHTYGLPGTYLLRLIAYNGFCRDTSSIEIKVSPVPKATFISNKTKGCTKEAITFQNLSENTQTYLWDFGDGSFSGSKNPTHTFTYERSPYTVKLIAYGSNGCSDTTVMTNYIQISRPPLANFEIAPDSVIKIPDFSFSFKNTSTDGAVSYLWDFGNGRTSTDTNPDYTYTDTGSYKVRLIAYNIEGCQDTLTRTVKINGVPGFLFIPNAFEPGSERQDLRTFKLRASGIAEFSMKIFNKWGEMIWESSLLDIDGVPVESWDGMMKGQPAPQGVYIWDVYAKFIDGTEWKGMKYEEGTKRKTGPVHLIR